MGEPYLNIPDILFSLTFGGLFETVEGSELLVSQAIPSAIGP
jgi:hypothetical protein